MKVERVDFVNVPTRDYERSIAFYRDVLGLPQNPRVPTEFEAGNRDRGREHELATSAQWHESYEKMSEETLNFW